MKEITVLNKAGEITCDFDGAKAYLAEQLESYRGLLFTEDTKKDAKATVAELRKEKKAFTDRIKEVKNDYMAPFEDFQTKAFELVELYDEPINFINGQIEDFEKKRIEEKKQLIAEVYAELVPEAELQEYIPLAKIYNSKWENATTKEKAIREEIMDYKEKTKSAISTITGMHSDVEELALDMFKQNFDIAACVVYITNHEKQKAEILAKEQERIRREEEERIRREERAKLEEERRHEEELKAAEMKAEQEKQAAIEKAKAETLDLFIPEYTGEEAEAHSYVITMTNTEKEALELYMNSIGLEFTELSF